MPGTGMEPFRQSTSITRKLTWGILVVSLLFLLDFLGSYLASRTLYGEIAALRSNRQLSNATTALRQVTESILGIPAAKGGLQSLGEFKRVYATLHEQAVSRLAEMRSLAGADPDYARALGQIASALDQMNQALQRYFERPGSGETPDLIVARQLGLEAGEGIARLKLIIDRKAASIYQALYFLRYRPLIVSAILTLAFILAALAGGHAAVTALRRSLSRLMEMTREIARGNLDTRAPVMSQDELGALTHAFNIMSAALRESTVSKAYVETIVESLPDLLFVVDMEGKILSSNRIAANVSGVEPKELVGRSLWSFVDSREPGFEQGFFSLSRGQAISERETVFHPAHGESLPVAISAAALRSKEGQVTEVVCIAHDITERKEIEAQERVLSEVTARISESIEYRTTIRNAVQAIVSRMGDWGFIQVLAADGAAETVEAYAATEDAERLVHEWLSKAALLELTWPPGLEARAQIKSPLIYRNRTLGMFTLASTDPERHYGEADMTLLQELLRRTAIAIENSRLYLQAREAIASRDEFLSIASHEMRTPMTALSLRLQLLDRNVKRAQARWSSEKSVSAADLAQTLAQADLAVGACLDQSRNLTALLDDLLDLTRIRTGKLQLAKKEVDLESLIKTAAERFKEELAQRNIPLSIRTEPILGYWDPTRIEQIASNLISNAIKYGQGSPITVRIERDETASKARILVSDRGAGIPEQMREKIFERFERGAAAGKSITGFGLGLYICRQIAEAHGGSIRVESQENVGSTFIVELPLPRAESREKFAG